LKASGKSPLHFVSQYGMTSAAKLLVDRGASMDARCNGSIRKIILVK